MLYTTRSIAEALNISLACVRNDVARGMIRPVRRDRHIGNRFAHDEVMLYYQWRMDQTSRRYPSLPTVLRVLKRCTGQQLTKVYGLARTAQFLQCSKRVLARSNYNYRQTRKRSTEVSRG